MTKQSKATSERLTSEPLSHLERFSINLFAVAAWLTGIWFSFQHLSNPEESTTLLLVLTERFSKVATVVALVFATDALCLLLWRISPVQLGVEIAGFRHGARRDR